MRICILTQPLGANFGGILQAYALQKALKDMGHDVTTLRFSPQATWWIPSGLFRKWALTVRRFFSKYLKGNKGIIYCNPDRQTRYAFQELNRFINENIEHMDVQAPLTHGTLPDFDAYVVGSDQVWRPAYSPFLPNFYLDFVAGSTSKRIAYAASFGVDTWEADEETTTLIQGLAKRFDAITVREESGVELCQSFLGVQAAVMPDPTLLLSADDYLQLCARNLQEQVDYIAAYILDQNDQVRSFVARMAAQLHLPVKYIGKFDWSTGVDSVESWISGIANARYVITDSFHGTVFSLLFKKDFFSLINHERGASRFESLLDTVGLHDHLLDKHTLEVLPIWPEIPWDSVSAKMEEMQQKGLRFLNSI